MFIINKIKISLGCDHAGFGLKEDLKKAKIAENFLFVDRGCFSCESVDYPDFSKLVVNDIITENCDFGLLICNSGIGMSIAANRYNNIRAALCSNISDVESARKHNNANILVIAARNTQLSVLEQYLYKFIEVKFDAGRHLRRIEKIDI